MKIRLLSLCLVVVTSICACSTTTKESNIHKEENTIISEKPEGKKAIPDGYFDYDDLGVEKYNYDEEFSLNSNLESAIEVLATYGKYEVKSVNNEDWKKWFVDSYIQSMFDGYDYKKRVLEEQAGYMTREQVEYVSYSLTGDYIEFDSIDDKGINCNEALSSPSESFIIDDYTYSIDGKKIVVKANCHQYKKGSASEQTFLITTVLIKNPYSCFDGYSIESMDAEDVSPLEYGDGKEHEVNVYFSGIDYYENKVSVDYWSSDDDIEYAMFITVLVNSSQMNYLLENKQCHFSITYTFDEKMTSPVSQITAKEIRKIDKNDFSKEVAQDTYTYEIDLTDHMDIYEAWEEKMSKERNTKITEDYEFKNGIVTYTFLGKGNDDEK